MSRCMRFSRVQSKIENLAGVKHLTNFTSGLNSSLLDLKFKILQLCFNFLRILSRTGPTSLQKGITWAHNEKESTQHIREWYRIAINKKRLPNKFQIQNSKSKFQILKNLNKSLWVWIRPKSILLSHGCNSFLKTKKGGRFLGKIWCCLPTCATLI